MLRFPPFQACHAMEDAARNAPPLRQGSRGLAVALLQGALGQLKVDLPLSAQGHGTPDGIFGSETRKALISFQRRLKLKPDGVAGSETLLALDAEMMKISSGLPPAPLKKSIVPSSPHYETGIGDPPLRHDAGSGTWKSKRAEATYLALRQAIREVLPATTVLVGFDAAKHMRHYLDNSGRDFLIDLEGMVREVPSAKGRYEREVSQARAFVEQLPVGRHDLHSKVGEGGYNRQAENRNWYFAVGGNTTWGEGTARVKEGPAGREYELEFVYRFFDRYNWDAGKSVELAGIKVTDVFMGEFHRQGLAKEFDCRGSFKRRFTWKQGATVPSRQLHPAGDR